MSGTDEAARRLAGAAPQAARRPGDVTGEAAPGSADVPGDPVRRSRSMVGDADRRSEGAAGDAARGPEGRAGDAGRGSRSMPDEVARRAGGAAAWVARAVTRLVAVLRRGRALHPRGLLLEGTLTVKSELLGERGEHEVPVRLSKGVSLPGRLPDVLGLAVRLPNGVDLLLSTGYGLLPVPRRGFTAGPYSTLASYRCGSRRRRIVARPERGGRVPVDPAELPGVLERRDLVFHLWAGVRYPGRLRVHTALTGRDLTFDPLVNSLPHLRPASRLQVLRGAAYEGSRQGRRAKLGRSVDQPENRSVK